MDGYHSGHLIVQGLFPRLLGGVYCLAFASLAVQVPGLYGSRGIVPIRDFLAAVEKSVGGRKWLRVPTLFWLAASDRALSGAAILGVVLSLLLVAGLFPVPLLVLLWLLYLSFVSAGEEFLSYQWDALLLETGFMAIFLPIATPAPSVAIAAWWFFLFRFIFSSGWVKLASGDPTWRDLTAMSYHYETQPLPNRGGWYAHQLPRWVQRLSTLGTFVFELGVPFLCLGPAPVRLAAFGLLVFFQLFIMATGNYCFFNILACALAVPLLDDRYLPFIQGVAAAPPAGGTDPLAAGFATAAFALFIGLNLAQFIFLFWRPAWLRRLMARLAPFMISNPYGLFAVMTTERFEFVIEGSDDLATWKPYEFRWKPGDTRVPPRQAAPHQPRLDWQMWFAALNPQFIEPWLATLARRILEGVEPVMALLGPNPFPAGPPLYVRFMVYRYRFTDRATRKMSGEWWTRRHVGSSAPMTLRGKRASDEPRR